MSEIDNEINKHFSIIHEYTEQLVVEVAREDSVPDVCIGMIYNLQESVSNLKTFIHSKTNAVMYLLKHCA